jgi:hypothetical protein
LLLTLDLAWLDFVVIHNDMPRTLDDLSPLMTQGVVSYVIWYETALPFARGSGPCCQYDQGDSANVVFLSAVR